MSKPPSVLSELLSELRMPRAAGRVVPYPAIRNFVLDVLEEGGRKKTINLVFDVELTRCHTQLEVLRHAGTKVSLTTLVAKAFADTIAQDKKILAYRFGNTKQVIFDEIDLSFMVERDVEHAPLPLVHIVRNASNKSLDAIQAELQTAKTASLGEASPLSRLQQFFFLRPKFIRRIVWFFIRRDPYAFKQLVGTAGVTSMGMFATGAAVVQPITPMTLTLSIGSTSERVVMEHGLPVARDFLHLNLGADHAVIDGAPLMRFAEAFKQRLGA